MICRLVSSICLCLCPVMYSCSEETPISKSRVTLFFFSCFTIYIWRSLINNNNKILGRPCIKSLQCWLAVSFGTCGWKVIFYIILVSWLWNGSTEVEKILIVTPQRKCFLIENRDRTLIFFPWEEISRRGEQQTKHFKWSSRFLFIMVHILVVKSTSFSRWQIFILFSFYSILTFVLKL